MTRRVTKRNMQRQRGGDYTQHLFKVVAFDGTDQDAQESITVHHDAILKAFHYSFSATSVAAGNRATIEVSDSGNYQAETSDNPNTIAAISLYGNGVSVECNLVTGQITGINMVFQAGEKIYLNANGTNGRSGLVGITFYWEPIE